MCNIEEDMRGVMGRTGLTDGAVLSIEASARAVTLVLVLAVPHTHTPVLAGEITAWVHCGKQEQELMSETKEEHSSRSDTA